MTTTITDLTDLAEIEDSIALWVEAASTLPTVVGQAKAYWAGFDFERKRPYATLGIVSQTTLGKPWSEITTVSMEMQTILFAPFAWSVDINFYTDSYNDGDDDDGTVIRLTARHFAQRLQNRAFLTENKNILDAVNIAYAQLGQTVSGSGADDEDKRIQKASVEFRFNGIIQTKIIETDFFDTVTTPTTTLSGE